MNSNINLLVTKKKLGLTPAIRHLLMFRLVTTSILFLVGVFSVILLIAISFSPLPQLRQEEARELQILAASQADVAKMALIHERVTTISSLLENRTAFATTLQTLQSFMPAGLSVSGFSLAKDNTSITVESNSLLPLDTYINTLMQEVSQKKYFSQIILTNLSIDAQTNSYSLTLTIQPL